MVTWLPNHLNTELLKVVYFYVRYLDPHFIGLSSSLFAFSFIADSLGTADFLVIVHLDVLETFNVAMTFF